MRRAERIIHATCTDRQSYFDSRHRLVTRYTFRIAETLKGRPDPLASFVTPGGELNGLATVIPGLSGHAIGDEVILFLGPAAPDQAFCLPVGLDQGIYRVALDPGDGSARVRRSLDALHLAPPPRGEGLGEQLRENIPLEEFKAAVRARVLKLRGEEQRERGKGEEKDR
ncbi:MAG: hypothetical protein ACE5GW_08615 [Planctomycetota bacterium]